MREVSLSVNSFFSTTFATINAIAGFSLIALVGNLTLENVNLDLKRGYVLETFLKSPTKHPLHLTSIEDTNKNRQVKQLLEITNSYKEKTLKKPTLITRNRLKEAQIDIKHNLNSLGVNPDPIDGAVKIMAFAFTFNGERIQKLDLASLSEKIPKLIAKKASAINSLDEKIKMANAEEIPLVEDVITVTESSISKDSTKFNKLNSNIDKISTSSLDPILSMQEELREDLQNSESNQGEDIQEAMSESKQISQQNVVISQHDPFESQLFASGSISNTVGNTIEREISRMNGASGSSVPRVNIYSTDGKAKGLNTHKYSSPKLDTQKKKGNSQRAYRSPIGYSKGVGVINKNTSTTENDGMSSLVNTQDEVNGDEHCSFLSAYSVHDGIRAKVDLSAQEIEGSFIDNFSVRERHGKIEICSAATTGVFDLEVNRRGYLPTKFIWGQDQKQIEVILLAQEQMSGLRKELSFLSTEGAILIQNNSRDKVHQIISNHGIPDILYLGRALNVLEGPEGSEYILVGGRPGLVSIDLQNEKGLQIYSYLSVIPETGIRLLETNRYEIEAGEGIDFKLMRTMGEMGDYVLKDVEVKHFLSNKWMEKRGLNRINSPEVSNNSFPDFFEFREKDDVVFMGVNRSLSNYQIPDHDFRESIIRSMFGEDEIPDGSCLIQINVSKGLEEFEMALDSGVTESVMEKLFLDRDGTFGDTPTSETSNIFVAVRESGILSGKLVFIDGIKDGFLSACVDKSYLLEQR